MREREGYETKTLILDFCHKTKIKTIIPRGKFVR